MTGCNRENESLFTFESGEVGISGMMIAYEIKLASTPGSKPSCRESARDLGE